MIDAYTELSAFLSLAADNAKSPTLSKINAGTDCIGLYTSGIMLGIPRDLLVDLISSPTGRLMHSLMSGNKFRGDWGKKDLQRVREYINNGPFSNVSDFKAEIN
jgi:hypothetical protein